MMTYDMGNWSFLGHGGFMIIWWVVIIAVIVGVVLFIKQSASSKSDSESHLEILKKRYAKGDISLSQFNKMKEELS